jgi:hypothetical protein
MNNNEEMLHKVQNYRKIVLIYEGLHARINKLIMENGGGTEKMSPADLQLYRQLATQRDEVMNEMRVLEMQLLDEDES